MREVVLPYLLFFIFLGGVGVGDEDESITYVSLEMDIF